MTKLPDKPPLRTVAVRTFGNGGGGLATRDGLWVGALLFVCLLVWLMLREVL